METAGGGLTARMQLLIWRPVQSAPRRFIYFPVCRAGGLSAVSSLTAAGLSALPPAPLRLAEHPPALPGRVWGGLRGGAGDGGPAWPGLCAGRRSPPAASSRTQNVIAQPPADRRRPGCQGPAAVYCRTDLLPSPPSWFPRALCSCRAATPCGLASRSPARTPAPGIGPLGAGHRRLLAHSVLVLTCVCSSRTAHCDDGGGQSALQRVRTAFGWATLVPATRSLCPQPSLVLVGAVVGMGMPLLIRLSPWPFLLVVTWPL